MFATANGSAAGAAVSNSNAACNPASPGPGSYLPKPRLIYEALESGVWPKRPNILTSDDDPYWRAVRQAAAPCFSMSNMKKVGGGCAASDKHCRAAEEALFA